MNFQHLVFYDGVCGLCDQVVQFIILLDQEKQFAFAPLQGETAKDYLKELPPELRQVDSVILVENYQTKNSKIYVRSKAIFRVFWLIGRGWVLLGWLFFLPSFLFDWGYRLIARYRHRLFAKPEQCPIPSPDVRERFLP